MKKTNRCYVDIHVLQTVPPSCINRDDTGSPKIAVYGGVTRSRVSSQAWKRAVRLDFQKLFSREQLGFRTKKALSMITQEIMKLEPSMETEEAEKRAGSALEKAGLSLNKDKETDVLLFMSVTQAKALAELVMSNAEDKNAYKTALRDNPSVDQILFGRMVASDPSLNYDAAVQVAHAISTHAVQNEFDYFTAVDDRAPEDQSGAGHIGTTEYNSATLYRYATVNVNEIAAWLSCETAEVVKGFTEAFCCSMPTGKQNTFANRTLPDLIYVAIRNDQPVNLVGAFEKPIVAGKDGHAAASEIALKDYAERTYALFVPQPALSLCTSRHDIMPETAKPCSLPLLLEELGKFVTEYLAKTEEM